MSFVVNWENVQADGSLNSQLQSWLNERLSSLPLPDFLANLQVVGFQLGDTPPDITIRDITEPFKEFYHREDDSEQAQEPVLPPYVPSSRPNSPTPSLPAVAPGPPAAPMPFRRSNTGPMSVGISGMLEKKDLMHNLALNSPTIPKQYSSEKAKHDSNYDQPDQKAGTGDFDIQFSTDIKWDSDIYIEIKCDLIVNYPSPKFITLPVRLKITDMKIHTLLIISHISKHVFLSFLCDIEDEDDELDDLDFEFDQNFHMNSPDSPNGSDFETSRQNSRAQQPLRPHKRRSKHQPSKERIDIVKDMNIEGELGSEEWQQKGSENEALILKSIGKIEVFLINAFRSMMVEEMAWPNWLELDFNE